MNYEKYKNEVYDNLNLLDEYSTFVDFGRGDVIKCEFRRLNGLNNILLKSININRGLHVNLYLPDSHYHKKLVDFLNLFKKDIFIDKDVFSRFDSETVKFYENNKFKVMGGGQLMYKD